MKKFWTKVKNWLVAHKPSKRRIIQLYAALLFNANIKGYITGVYYQGPLKFICSPGLNCYSCPGASGACPLGSLQNALYASNKKLPFYMFGIIILYGILLGRWICSFLCPFGLIQELLHKIKTPKLPKGRVTRILSYLKYVILIVFVVGIPLIYMFKDFPLPAFCKYICPAGVLEALIPLISNKENLGLFELLNVIFNWKFTLMIGIVTSCIFIYRAFCRFICPLGALYGLFNKISIFGVKVEKSKCTHCNICVNKCKMDIKHVGDQECISCGECIDSCPTGAISWKGSKIILHANEIKVDENVTPIGTPEYDAAVEKKKKKIKTRNIWIKVCVITSLVALLIGVLVYYNFVDGKGTETPTDEPTVEVPTEPIVETDGLDFELSEASDYYIVTGRGTVAEGEIVIPSTYNKLPVKEIKASAFENQTDITKVVIPNSIEKIGDKAFFGCGSIEISCQITTSQKPAGWSGNWYDADANVTYLAPPTGNKVGNTCPTKDLATYVDGETFNITSTRGKVTIINFWGTWCGPCKAELPHFNDIANEYGDDVAVVLVHTTIKGNEEGDEYIAATFPDTKMILVRDENNDGDPNMEDYYKLLGGNKNGTYPMTVIVDAEGVITFTTFSSVDHNTLKEQVEKAMK